MTTQRLVWMNGRLVFGNEATVPILSHGFSRGSAIFESFGTHESPQGPAAYRMDEHLKRLRRSADRRSRRTDAHGAVHRLSIDSGDPAHRRDSEARWPPSTKKRSSPPPSPRRP